MHIFVFMKRILVMLFAALAISVYAEDFKARDVKIENHEAGITLAGTLTEPVHKPAGAIVMATGSGPQNRDEEVYGHKPFKVIADYLSAHGYLVLRMDDRGVGESEGIRTKCTSADFATDIAAGLQWLDSCYKDVPKGVIGHSEGGIIALMCAPKCDFIITLAGPAWSGDSIVMSQSRAAAVGMTGHWEYESVQRRLLDTAKSGMSDLQARAALTLLMNEVYGDMARIPDVQKQIAAQVDGLLSPWYRNFLRYDPAEAIKAVSVPWLALNGEKDTQVHPDNLITFKELNPIVDTLLLPDHNHLFQHCITGLPNEYASINEDFSEDALEAILEWLDNRL